jgi:hypothetical protein
MHVANLVMNKQSDVKLRLILKGFNVNLVNYYRKLSAIEPKIAVGQNVELVK